MPLGVVFLGDLETQLLMLCSLFAGSDVLIPDPAVCANRNFPVLMQLRWENCTSPGLLLPLGSGFTRVSKTDLLVPFCLCWEWVASVCKELLARAGPCLRWESRGAEASSGTGLWRPPRWDLAPSGVIFHENLSPSGAVLPQMQAVTGVSHFILLLKSWLTLFLWKASDLYWMPLPAWIELGGREKSCEFSECSAENILGIQDLGFFCVLC